MSLLRRRSTLGIILLILVSSLLWAAPMAAGNPPVWGDLAWSPDGTLLAASGVVKPMLFRFADLLEAPFLNADEAIPVPGGNFPVVGVYYAPLRWHEDGSTLETGGYHHDQEGARSFNSAFTQTWPLDELDHSGNAVNSGTIENLIFSANSIAALLDDEIRVWVWPDVGAHSTVTFSRQELAALIPLFSERENLVKGLWYDFTGDATAERLALSASQSNASEVPVYILDLTQDKAPISQFMLPGVVLVAAWDATSERIAIASSADLAVYDPRSGQRLQQLETLAPDRRVTRLEWGPDQQTLAVVYNTGELELRPVTGGAVTLLAEDVVTIAWHPEGQYLAAASWYGDIRLIEVPEAA